MSEPAYWAVIPAAGVGRRMGSAVPKQYLQLADRAVIDHSIERILQHPRVDGVYVAISDADSWWKDTEFAGHPDLVTVSGGAERCHSVLNALEALRARASDDDWVLVHDAARPCVRRADIDRLIDAAIGSDAGAVLGMPVRDTMKRCDADERVVETVERNHLWHAFTPQMFRFGTLHAVLGRALAAGVLVTDEASAIEWDGQHPVMVEGHADNIKITRAEDLGLAAHYLAQQASFGQPG